jgi:hypothetical protein
MCSDPPLMFWGEFLQSGNNNLREKISVNSKKIQKNSKTKKIGEKKLGRSMLFVLQKHPPNDLVNQE